MLFLLASGCATIVSKSNYPIMINSTPSEAGISITDKKGVEVYRGKTPATVKLRAGSGYFSRALYLVKFDKPGYDIRVVPIEYKLDGWYFGNIVFGGLIGMLIVDPASGAMYKLDTEFIHEDLSQSTSGRPAGELKVYALDDLPADWHAHLVKLPE